MNVRGPRLHVKSTSAAVGLALVAITLAVPPAVATDYYVSRATGDDARSGLSPAEAWRNLSRASAFTFSPGDRILIEGGRSHLDVQNTGLVLDASDSATPANPIVVTSYGSDPFLIAPSGTEPGILIRDRSDVIVEEGIIYASWCAVQVENAIAGTTVSHVRLREIAVAARQPICVWSMVPDAPLQDVRIERVHVEAANGRAGIDVDIRGAASRSLIYVGDTLVERSEGRLAPWLFGIGIRLAGAHGAVVERSVIRRNGTRAEPVGSYGIVVEDSTGVTIQHNELYENESASGSTGGGILLGDGAAGALVQYNYTHDNQGPGIAIASEWGPSTNHVVRYNLSQNDARLHPSGAIHVRGAASGADIYHNTLYMDALGAGAGRAAIMIENGGIETLDATGIRIRNNLLLAASGAALVSVAPTQLDGGSFLFQGNLYWSYGAPFRIDWGPVSHASLAAWRTVTGQEMAGAAPAGIEADPRIAAPGQAPELGDARRLESLVAYRLEDASPATNAALDLAALAGIDAGPRDFWGTALPAPAGRDVGANERTPLLLLRADLLALAPRTPPLDQVYPFDPAAPLTPPVVWDFAPGDSDPGTGPGALGLYQVHPPIGRLRAAKDPAAPGAVFDLR